MTPASKSRPAASGSDEPASFFAVTAALVMSHRPPEVAESARDLAALSSARAAATTVSQFVHPALINAISSRLS